MRFKRASFLTKIVVLVLLIYLATSLLDLRGQIQSLQGELEGKEQQVADLRQENEEKSYAIENSDNPEVIEEVARENYRQLEAIVDEDVPCVELLYTTLNVGATKKVVDFQMDRAGYHNLETVVVYE